MDALKNCCKTASKGSVTVHLSSTIAITTARGIAQAKPGHRHHHGNPVDLSQDAKTRCLGGNSESPSSCSKRNTWASGSAPSLVRRPQRSLLKGKFRCVPLEPDWFLKLERSFPFSCALYNSHFGSPASQQPQKWEDSPRVLESAADNTLHLKFLLVFYLGTLQRKNGYLE